MKIWLLDKSKNIDSYENRRFSEEAVKLGIDFSFVAVDDFDLIVASDTHYGTPYDERPGKEIDCLISRLGSGATYFALSALRHLEQGGIFTLNPSRSVEVGRDKLATIQCLAGNNIPIPKTMLAKFPFNVGVVDAEFDYPVIVKLVSGSRGRGIVLCENRGQMEDLGELLEISTGASFNVIIQEFVSSSRGKDIRVIVVGSRAIGGMLRIAGEGMYKANYSRGGTVSKFELNPTVEWLAVESAKTIGLDIAGVDLLFDGDNYRVCEVNCAPGFEGFEIATGINVPMEIYQYIQVRLEGILSKTKVY
jgi:RimK family alpha-L-glutamate ligase